LTISLAVKQCGVRLSPYAPAGEGPLVPGDSCTCSAGLGGSYFEGDQMKAKAIRGAWQREYKRAVRDLADLRERIDLLGCAVGDDRADQLGCYASNSLEGVLALLRELLAHKNGVVKGLPR